MQETSRWCDRSIRDAVHFADANGPTRPNKCLEPTSRTEGYAREELVAELGAAFLCADLELTPEPRADHSAYIQGWLKVLKEDKRAIFSAAAHAQRAADFLRGLQSVADTEEGAAA
nr:zincin-like metallopeptidase domain-containing protein [Rhizobium sp. CG5]